MSRKSEIELTNMCMVYDKNRVLVEEKDCGDYKGVVFPGGHVEQGESLCQSVIREIYEETGLKISSPKLCGVKNWINDDGTRYMVLLYKTDKFTGTLQSSEEGRVFWVDKDKLKDEKLIWNMEELFEIMEREDLSEFFFKYDDRYDEEKHNTYDYKLL